MASRDDPKPIIHPTPVQPALDGDFHLGDQELFLFDCIASEVNHIAGTDVDFYYLNKGKSKKDALYDEMVKEAWDGPYRLRVWVEWPAPSPEPRQEGFREVWMSSLWVARVDLDAISVRAPYYGDVVGFWKIPYFDKVSNAYDVGKNPKGYFFTITEVADDGHLFDNPSFVGFKCQLARNTEFVPERRLTNQ